MKNDNINSVMSLFESIKKEILKEIGPDYEYEPISPEEIELDKNRGNFYFGRNVDWLGYKGRMFRATPYNCYPIEGNIFYEEKLERVADLIIHGEERFTFYAPYGMLSKVDYIDVKESLYNDEDVLTTGDEEVDEYLKLDWEEYVDEHLYYLDPLDDEEEIENIQEDLQNRLENAVENNEGDLGSWRCQVRDGNHRTFGAFKAGEPYVWIIISEDQIEDNKNNPEFMKQLH